LHDRGDERSFWESRSIDAVDAAQKLWAQSRAGTGVNAAEDAATLNGTERSQIDETRFMVDPPGGSDDVKA
jgi:hypothetical protein